MSLANRQVVVTGGGSGVGAATARASGREPVAPVTILGRRADALADGRRPTSPPSPAMSPT